jgi:hypothetical protein
MKLLIALVLAAAPSFAADTTYTTTPPASGSTCPKVNDTVTSPCFYVVLGDFTDTYQFSVEADATYTRLLERDQRPCSTSAHLLQGHVSYGPRAHGVATRAGLLTVTNAVAVPCRLARYVLQLAAVASGVGDPARAELSPAVDDEGPTSTAQKRPSAATEVGAVRLQRVAF